MNPKYQKLIKRILIILCGLLIVAAAVVSVLRYVEEKKDTEITDEKNNQTKFSYYSYDFNEIGSVDYKDINLDDYVPLTQFGEFYLADNDEMFERALELTYISEIDYSYYINNECYSCEIEGNDHYYFFGKDKDNLMFYLKINEKWDISEWYVRSDFAVPTAKLNRVNGIVIVSTNEAEDLLSNSLENTDLRRINTEDAINITDKETVKKYVKHYKEGTYIFNESFDGNIKTAKEDSMCGYVLASFENSEVLQCIGVY